MRRLYESLLIWRGQPVLAAEHLARLRASLRALDLRVPKALELLPERTAALATGMAEGYARWEGPDAGGFFSVQVQPLPDDVPPRRHGCHAVTFTGLRPAAGHKHTDRALADAAQRYAADHAPFPAEALLVSPSGAVLEGARTNVWAVCGRRVWTPRAAGRLLPGVMRGVLVSRWAEAGVTVVEADPLPLSLLRHADAMFVTSSLLGIGRVLSLDGQATGDAPLPALPDCPAWLCR